VDLVNDGWTDIITQHPAGRTPPACRRRGREHRRTGAARRLQKMERVRARVDAVVKDRATAEALKPWYNQFCKRPASTTSTWTRSTGPTCT
jgi:cyclohexanone monooxygenase